MEINTVIQAVKGRLEALWPGETVYEDRLPSDFTRPSSLLECGAVDIRDVNIGLIRTDLTIRITCFAAVDEYYDSSRAQLNERLDRCLGIFSGGALSVEKRYLTASAVSGVTEVDYAQATIRLFWTDMRPGYLDPESPGTPGSGGAQKMEHYALRT